MIEVALAGHATRAPSVRDLAKEIDAGGFLFAGDDLGDVEAFEAVAELREQGLPTLLVCSASDEESALVERSDVVVHGPDGVLDLLRQLIADAQIRVVPDVLVPCGLQVRRFRQGLPRARLSIRDEAQHADTAYERDRRAS